MQIEDGKSYVLFKMDRRSEGRGDKFFIKKILKEKKDKMYNTYIHKNDRNRKKHSRNP